MSANKTRCPHCMKKIDPAAKVCPYCQRSLKKTSWIRLIIFGVVALVLILAGLKALAEQAVGLEDEIQRDLMGGSDGYDVTYEVKGLGTTAASVTYDNAQGNTEQRDISLPWNKDYDDVPPGTFLYISAQNDQDSGSITCRIIVNGLEIEKATSDGAYVIATCSGRLP